MEKKKLLDKFRLTYETEDKRHEGQVVLREYIKGKIRKARVVLVLIGDDTHNHPWIKAEVEFANSFKKPIICVRVPKTEGESPEILNKYEIFPFDPIKIVYELNRLL